MPARTSNPSENPGNGAPDARERLLDAAYELFASQGVQAVGVDRLIERADVARQTMYRQFDSKQELVLAFLERREQLWTRGWLQDTVQRSASEPRARLLAIFDAFDRWFHEPSFEGCSFISVMLEHPDPDHPVHRACAAHLQTIRGYIAQLAQQDGIVDPDSFARDWHILMKGSIVAAAEGDTDAARRARRMAERLLADGGWATNAGTHD